MLATVSLSSGSIQNWRSHTEEVLHSARNHKGMAFGSFLLYSGNVLPAHFRFFMTFLCSVIVHITGGSAQISCFSAGLSASLGVDAVVSCHDKQMISCWKQNMWLCEKELFQHNTVMNHDDFTQTHHQSHIPTTRPEMIHTAGALKVGVIVCQSELLVPQSFVSVQMANMATLLPWWPWCNALLHTHTQINMWFCCG